MRIIGIGPHVPTAHVPDLTGLIVAAAADGSILVTLHPRD